MVIEIVDLPINSMVMFHSYVAVYQRVYGMVRILFSWSIWVKKSIDVLWDNDPELPLMTYMFGRDQSSLCKQEIVYRTTLIFLDCAQTIGMLPHLVGGLEHEFYVPFWGGDNPSH